MQIDACVLAMILYGELNKAHEHWSLIHQYGVIFLLNQDSITVLLCICFL